MIDPILLGLGVITITAAFLGFIAQLFKQPPLLGYILAGFVLSVLFIDPASGNELLSTFSHLGVAFLLFMLGIELNIKEVHEVGVVSLITGVGQVLVTSILGFSLARFLFGYGLVESLYIGVALTFSSTIIIVKLLGEKGDLNSLYGRISVGLLIVQDLIAIVALIILNSLSTTEQFQSSTLVKDIALLITTGILLCVLVLIVGRLVAVVLSFLQGNTELLLLAVISWALLLSMGTVWMGFSLEVGAFLAGLVLAASPMSTEIAAKIKPLRDFFIIIFFVLLGTNLSPEGVRQNLGQVGIFSLSVLVGNPLILLAIMGTMGYHRRVSFLTGLTVSQISEFSLILISAGVVLGQVSSNTLAMMTGVGIITLVGSSYLIGHGDSLYKKLSLPLKIFERGKLKHGDEKIRLEKDQVLLIGGDLMGRAILRECLDKNIKVLVVDYDPVLIKRLKKMGVDAVYGDIADTSLLEQFDLAGIRVVISTIPELEDNLFLLSQIKEANQSERSWLSVIRAKSRDQALELKEQGADYTLVPESIAGEKIVEILNKNGVLENLSKEI